MARISASIPEELKDELYQAATDSGLPISHIIVEALRKHLDSPAPNSGRGSSVDISKLESQMRQVVSEVQSLKGMLGSRTPPKGVRYF